MADICAVRLPTRRIEKTCDTNPVRDPAQVDGGLPVRNAILAGILLLYAYLWLASEVFGRFAWLRNAIRPYTPDWLALAILFFSPVTCAIAGLDSVGFGTRTIFCFVFGIQAAVMGLAAGKHPVLSGLVTIFLYLETFVLIPGLNRRLRGISPYTTLQLQQRAYKPNTSDARGSRN